ncbi:RIP metalloprotease RseP [Sandaracinobacteroides saxicola]|uniref:Zinc metalloprotease n=1 Tax=Sandaracinobacteroides saxicola TaxID=2759707 RepID=A0A7G5IKW4_9SPHN|nr:RIP metalloprotease RseP [Sandaracinobacteroides saxicola]QMW24006.1 RIP metalloprotease RseP [Sandaracinobacteroides saxicola]
MDNPGLLFSLAAFAVVIGVLVFVHEFGHYGVARLFGIKVDTFAVGFGREVLGWTDRAGTRWKLGWLPLGGYAKFAGDMNAASQPDPALAALPEDERAALFQFRPLWQRAAVVAAGPAINFLFAILLFTVFFMTWGHEYTPPVVGGVAAESPAAKAGLRAGDRIVAVDGDDVERFEDLVRVVRMNTGTPLSLTVERGTDRLTLRATPRIISGKDRFGSHYSVGMLGMASGRPVVVRRWPVDATVHAVKEVRNITVAMAEGLHQVVTGRRDLTELGGPIKIAQFSGQSAALGLQAFVTFIALISINLGFMNLLPIPMLDGGHLLLYAVEGVRRRPLNPKIQEWAFMSGFALLLTLMLVLTWNDLASAGVWKHLAGLAG